ncbi:MAG: alpha-D-ribose 1-methylphosphonate 5-triphosphate diphosphatase [Rhizobiaceae bacterium]
MTDELVLRNARIVLADEVITGRLVVRDGLIADVDDGRSAIGIDLDGDFLIPGLVELHTDHLESHFSPRPKVRWNPHAALLAHDAQIAASGVTTVLDALRVGLDEDADLNADEMRRLADAIDSGVAAGRLRAEHYIHLRCEVSAPDCAQSFERFADDPRVRMISLMDHSPGQRQFASLEAYATYYQGKLKMPDDEFRLFCARRMAQSAEFSTRHRAILSAASRERAIVLASHDDATRAHVAEAVADGITVAEFPTTMEAARASREAGLAILMGGPNVVRGGSHSGNVSARSLAEAGMLDIISSDYIPFSLIQSAFFLGEVVDGISLPRAIAMVTKTPADSIRLQDRGEIAVGKRADLVRVRIDEHVPVIRSVWRGGDRVA